MKYLICIAFLTSLNIFSQTQEYRYRENIANNVNINNNLTYRTALYLDSPYTNESNTTSGSINCDIYTPTGDTFTNRPAVILAHAGAFLVGNKSNLDFVALSDSLARKGYVVININYRKGYNLINNVSMHSQRAVYRATQDGRAAVRYFRKNAATYGIDPSKVYWIGSSAGSVIGLSSIYYKEDERPSESYAVSYSSFGSNFTGPDLGSLDNGDNLAQNGKPDAVISLWGGISPLGAIDADEGTPLFLIHGTDDTIVPFNEGHAFEHPSMLYVYGSNIIKNRLDQFGIEDIATYFVDDVGHEFHGYETTSNSWTNGTGGNLYWDEITKRIFAYLHYLHKPIAKFLPIKNGLQVSFTNISSDTDFVHWDFGDGNTSNSIDGTHTYSASGKYTVKLYIENANKSWDEKEILINVASNIKTEAGTLQYNFGKFYGFNGSEWISISN